jgi:hypothetical protein
MEIELQTALVEKTPNLIIYAKRVIAGRHFLSVEVAEPEFVSRASEQRHRSRWGVGFLHSDQSDLTRLVVTRAPTWRGPRGRSERFSQGQCCPTLFLVMRWRQSSL